MLQNLAGCYKHIPLFCLSFNGCRENLQNAILMKPLRVLKLRSHLAHTERHCYVMDKTTSYNKTQKGELSESCWEIDVDHILNATESSVGREERKGNWENCISSIKRKKKGLNSPPKGTTLLGVLFQLKLHEA